MSPEDATNLLLALMYDGELVEAHQTVQRLRQATLSRCEGRRWGETTIDAETLPRNGWITCADGKPFNFGELIETMLDCWVRYGSLYEAGENGEEDIDLEPVNINLEVSSPGYRAVLTFNTPCSLFWRLHYEWKPPEQIKYEAENKGNRLATRWNAMNGSRISSTRSVYEWCLHEIADCLRGCEWRDEWDEYSPSYDRAPAPERQVEPA